MAEHASAQLGGAKSVPSVLTELAIKAARSPERGQVMMWDAALKHFGVRINQGGAKTFIVLVESGKRKSIGRWPTISLQQARAEAKSILAAHTLGRRGASPITSDEALKLYLADCEVRVQAGTMRSRTFRDYKRLLRKHFTFNRKQMSEINSHDIAARMDRIKDAPSERNHALVAAKIFFSWAQKPARRYVLTNPCEGIAPTKRPSRKRVLTEKELAAVYATAVEGGDDFSRIVTLLVLTGQRRGEIAALEWDWINTKNCTITIPASVTKNKMEHTFPYGTGVATVLRSLKEQSRYLFPATRATWRAGLPTTVFNAWGKSKDAFDKECGVTGWTLHDLRRTFGTNLAGLKVPPHIVERLINHKFGSIQNQTGGVVSAVAEVYNRHLYIEEMRDAIVAWEHWLLEVVSRPNAGIPKQSRHATTRRDTPRPAADNNRSERS